MANSLLPRGLKRKRAPIEFKSTGTPTATEMHTTLNGVYQKWESRNRKELNLSDSNASIAPSIGLIGQPGWGSGAGFQSQDSATAGSGARQQQLNQSLAIRKRAIPPTISPTSKPPEIPATSYPESSPDGNTEARTESKLNPRS